MAKGQGSHERELNKPPEERGLAEQAKAVTYIYKARHGKTVILGGTNTVLKSDGHGATTSARGMQRPIPCVFQKTPPKGATFVLTEGFAKEHETTIEVIREQLENPRNGYGISYGCVMGPGVEVTPEAALLEAAADEGAKRRKVAGQVIKGYK